MPATLEVESTLTDRYQTTVPETVRRALRLGKRDKIHYTIRPSGDVVLTRAQANDSDDPVLGAFLVFLAALGASGAGAVLTVRNVSVLFAVGLSYAIGERPGRPQVAGALLVTAGAILVGWPPR